MNGDLVSARRFAWIAAAALAVDFAALAGLLAAGLRLGAAHLVSFGLAASIAYALCRQTHAGDGASSEPSRLARFLVVCGLGLSLRASALALGNPPSGEPPPLPALLAAVAVGACAGYVGAALLAFRVRSLRRDVVAIALVAYALALRLLYLGLIDLIPEEAYYWNYAQHLDLGYVDHPPLVAWLVWLGTGLFGRHEFAVRIGGFACWLVAAGFVYGLARTLCDRASGLAALLLFAVLPYFFAVGLLMTPDAPLVAAWAGALFFLARALLLGQVRAWWGVGAALGIGLLSKYSIALLGIAALTFVLADRPSRRWLRRPEPYGAVVLAALLFSPVLLWNARHGWVSFAFQGPRRLAKPADFGLPWLVVSAALLLSPLGLAAALRALVRRDEFAGDDPRRFHRFVLIFTGVPLAVLIAFSLRYPVRANWTGPVWLAALPAIARGVAGQATAARPAGAGARPWAVTVIALLLLYGAGLQHLTLGLPGVGYPRKLRLPVGWSELGARVDALAVQLGRETGRPPLRVGMDHYFIASELAFYDPGRGAAEAVGRHLFGRHDLMYERWSPARLHDGQPLLLVSLERKDLEDDALAAFVDGLEPTREHILERGGRRVGRFYSRVARRYRAPSAASGE